MKLGTKTKVLAACLMPLSKLCAQDQYTATTTPPTYNQAGTVSVDMGTGSPMVPSAPSTAILAIYRGPGYFDESLLDISAQASRPASDEPEPVQPDSQIPNSSGMPQFPAPQSQGASGETAPPSESEPLPPPPLLPTEGSALPQGESTSPVNDQSVTPDTASAPQQDPQVDPSSPSAPTAAPGIQPPGPPTSQMVPQQSSEEPLPPPPSLEALPAFPSGN